MYVSRIASKENYLIVVMTFVQAMFYVIELSLIFVPCNALKNRVSTRPTEFHIYFGCKTFIHF